MDVAMPSFMKTNRREEEGNEPGADKKKLKVAGKAEKANTNDFEKLIQAIGHLSLDNAKETRELAGVLMQTFLVEETETWAQLGLKEGKEFAEMVKDQPGANLGSPHIRVGLKCLHSLMVDSEARPEFAKSMKEWWTVSVADKTSDEIA